jgi:hypothetical protein
MKFQYPAHWVRGQLLDLQRFTDGTYKAILLGDPIEKPEYLGLSNRDEAQQFISWWYAPASVRAQERECQDTPANRPKTEII